MFEQHPVPQQISSYQFRLVGDMTLKQFFQLAGGAVVGLLFYASPLPSIFKWPLIIISVVAGAAFAFLPLQERPLSEWIGAFFRAVYGPTLYTWQKATTKENFFLPNNGVVQTPVSAPAPKDASSAKLDALENKFLGTITGVLGMGTKNATVTPPAAPTPQVPMAPVQTPDPQVIRTQAPSIAPARVIEVENNMAVKETTPPSPTPGNLFVATPQAPNVKVEKHTGVEIKPEVHVSQMQTGAVTPFTQTKPIEPGVLKAQVSPESAPPAPPTIPNILVGQVLTKENKIVDSAIMEIKDFQGRPVRALKTNRLGHFMIVTPLPAGSYTITTEKEGMLFDPVSVDIHGTIIPSILIKSKN